MSKTAREIMSTAVITLEAKTRVSEAAAPLVEKRVSSAPVIEQDFTRKFLVGFVSEKDLMQAYASGAFYRQPDLTVAQVMRPSPVCVRPEADLFTLAAIFMQHGYRHVPVVVAQVLQGVVSRRAARGPHHGVRAASRAFALRARGCPRARPVLRTCPLVLGARRHWTQPSSPWAREGTSSRCSRWGRRSRRGVTP